MLTIIIFEDFRKITWVITNLYQRRICVICLALLYGRKSTCIERWLDIRCLMMLQSCHVADEGDERGWEILHLAVSQIPKGGLEGLLIRTAYVVGEENRSIECPAFLVDELGSNGLQLFGTHIIHQCFCIGSYGLRSMTADQGYA